MIMNNKIQVKKFLDVGGRVDMWLNTDYWVFEKYPPLLCANSRESAEKMLDTLDEIRRKLLFKYQVPLYSDFHLVRSVIFRWNGIVYDFGFDRSEYRRALMCVDRVPNHTLNGVDTSPYYLIAKEKCYRG